MNLIERVRAKYPQLIVNGKISLLSLGNTLQLYNYLLNHNILKGSGLETYKEDLKWILPPNIKKERRNKLDKIRELYEDNNR